MKKTGGSTAESSWQCSGSSLLCSEIECFLSWVALSDNEEELRNRTLKRFEAAAHVEDIADIFVVGSWKLGIGLPDSDIDIVVCGKEKESYPYDDFMTTVVFESLRKCSGLSKKVKLIHTFATVPLCNMKIHKQEYLWILHSMLLKM